MKQLAMVNWRYLFIILTLALSIPVGFGANKPESIFEQANRLYAQGKYDDAVTEYRSLIQEDHISPALYFNLGNALFKSGQLGRAIVSYRLGQLLSPRDADLRTNLRLARAKAIGGEPPKTVRWRSWLNRLTTNEWTLLTSAFVWIWLGLLILSQWKPTLRKSLSRYIALAAGLWFIVAACLGAQLYDNYTSTAAVIVVPETAVRYGPFEESRQAFALADGAEVSVLDQQDDWIQIQDTARRTGWVQRDHAIILKSGINPMI